MKSPDFHLEEQHGAKKDEVWLCLRYGSKLNATEFAMQSGGGAVNTAVGFSRLGLRAAVIAEMGTDLAAKLIIEELKEEKVDTSLLVQEPDEQTAVSSLLIAAEGGRSIVTARGAAKMLTVEDIPFAQLQCNWIHLSSIGNTEVVRQVAAHAKKHHIRFSWNPGGAELEAMVRGELHLHEVYPMLFVVNEEEAAALTEAGYDLETAGTVVVITAGREGGKYFSVEAHQWVSFQPTKVKAIQETGAGDAFVMGMSAAFLHDREVAEAVEWGKASSASVIQYMGAKTGLLREIPGGR